MPFAYRSELQCNPDFYDPKQTSSNVRFGSKADINRTLQLCPISGAWRTLISAAGYVRSKPEADIRLKFTPVAWPSAPSC